MEDVLAEYGVSFPFHAIKLFLAASSLLEAGRCQLDVPINSVFHCDAERKCVGFLVLCDLQLVACAVPGNYVCNARTYLNIVTHNKGTARIGVKMYGEGF